MKTLVVVPWHNPEQLARFLEAWAIDADDPLLLLQQDKSKEGCAKTKNAGIANAIDKGAETVIILDDDCLPETSGDDPIVDLWSFSEVHAAALESQQVRMFEPVTLPASRGTPYFNRSISMPVAASMSFWTGVGDYDAPGQLIHGAQNPMQFRREAMFGRYFPLCGMALAFNPRKWLPWCQFIDVPRFDDIWQGFLWQKEAYRRGYCFNLAGPLVRHSRQSNVWANLRDEAVHLERNETLWSDIANSLEIEYDKLRALLPV